MLRIIITLIGLLPIALPALAQTEIDGRTAFYDVNTDTYLVSVPHGYEAGSAPEGLNVEYTYLPILRLDGDFGNSYSEGTLTVSLSSGEVTTYPMKAKYRGGITNHSDRHKRNFHIKLLDKKGNSSDKSLLGMRKDNSWILDAGQVDLGRIRNHVAQEIWRDMGNAPYYAELKPNAKNYINMEFVEVFIGDSYFGLYSLGEAMDRKQLQLEKFDDDSKEIRGMLIKATNYTYTSMYGPFDAPDNNSGMWGSFEMHYPDIDDVCPTNWEPFYNAVTFVDESSTDDFRENVGEYFDLPICVDIFVFHTVLAATDHSGKNLRYACCDVRQGRPMFSPVVWDYDTTLGQTADNSAVHDEEQYGPEMGDFMYFAGAADSKRAGIKLLYRLAAGNVEDFVEKSLDRYWELRKTIFAEDSLMSRYDGYYAMLRSSGTLAREEARWSGDTDINGLTLDFDGEQAYIDDYIRRRMAYLDGLFDSESGIRSTLSNTVSTQPTRYNLSGQRVDESYKGIVIIGGEKALVR